MAEITLTKPIRHGGEDLTKITLNEPTIGMLDGVLLRITGEGELILDLQAIRVLIGRMAALPPTVAAQITVKDALAAKDVLADFFDDFLPTGGN